VRAYVVIACCLSCGKIGEQIADGFVCCPVCLGVYCSEKCREEEACRRNGCKPSSALLLKRAKAVVAYIALELEDMVEELLKHAIGCFRACGRGLLALSFGSVEEAEKRNGVSKRFEYHVLSLGVPDNVTGVVAVYCPEKEFVCYISIANGEFPFQHVGIYPPRKLPWNPL
jgi:hypothetical protein